MEVSSVMEIDAPPHYRQGTLEVIDAIEGMGLGDDYHLGNVVKYIARWKYKGGLKDLHKAAWYLNRRIAKAQEVVRG